MASTPPSVTTNVFSMPTAPTPSSDTGRKTRRALHPIRKRVTSLRGNPTGQEPSAARAWPKRAQSSKAAIHDARERGLANEIGRLATFGHVRASLASASIGRSRKDNCGVSAALSATVELEETADRLFQ